MYKLLLSILVFTNINLMLAQTPCENGTVNGFPCNQIDFYAQIDNATLSGTSGVEGNDIWGWTDPETGIEYALMGQTNGTVFVDLSNPSNPRIVGRLASHQNKSSLWRDIKVYKNHAFIVADNNSGHGMQVFDLTRLRSAGSSIEAFTEDAHYNGVSSAHNVVINEEKGYAYIVGARGAGNGCGAGGLHIVDISSPKSPEYIGCFDADGYTHDAQVVTYAGPDTEYVGRQIGFNSNENTITIADLEDPTNTLLISKQSYSASGYAHQGWLTEDHKYFISNDELDETRGLVTKTRTLIWDVRDLDSPTLINSYYAERNTIDHNLYTHDGKVYQSNYENGLVILDSELIGEGKMREIAYFDTFPNNNGTNFNGTWSNYPYFESGIVIVSDINRGLFILKPNIKNIIASHPNFTACNEQSSISVGVNNDVSVESYQWQSINGSIFTNLTDGDVYSGTSTAELTFDATKADLNEKVFRCKVRLTDGSETTSFPTNPLNILNLPASANFTYSNTGYAVQFTNLSANAESYLWDFGDGSEPSTVAQPDHVYAESGEYTVTLTAINGCGEDVSSETIALTEVITASQNKLAQSVKIFPVPANNALNIQLDDQSIAVKRLSVYNTTGTLMYQEAFHKNTIINTSKWQKGVYFAVFEASGNQQFSKTIVKN